MEQQQTATIRMFGIFHTLRRERGLAPAVEFPLTRAGAPARAIARELNLPLEMIGGVYCNHAPADLQLIIRPGDRIAFVPRGVPGPHRCLQGFPPLPDPAEHRDLPLGFEPAPLPAAGAGVALS
jgi:hypothetical protein